MEQISIGNIFRLLAKNAKTLVMVCVATAVVSFGISFVLKEKYKSEAVVYPINMYQTSEESTTEQLLQYFHSEDVKYQIAKELDLFGRYGIDTVNEKGGRALFGYMIQDNFKVSPTLYESIELSVTDTDPVMARKLCSRWIALTNELIRESKQFTQRQYVVNARSIISKEQRELDSMSNEIKKLRGEFKGNESEKEANAKDASVKGNSDVYVLKGRIKSTLKSMVDIKEQLYKFMLDSEGKVDFILPVTKPTLSDKRSYPVRWIIVLVSTLSAAFFTSLIIVIRNRVRG